MLSAEEARGAGFLVRGFPNEAPCGGSASLDDFPSFLYTMENMAWLGHENVRWLCLPILTRAESGSAEGGMYPKRVHLYTNFSTTAF